MDHKLLNIERRKILIGGILVVIFSAVWHIAKSYFKSGQIEFTGFDLFGSVSFVMILGIFEIFARYLPMKRAIAELKSKGYFDISEETINSYQYRNVELGLDFNATCELCLNYLKSLSNCEIVIQDCDDGFLAAKHRINEKKITRDRIEFDIQKQSDDVTTVEISRGPKLDLGGLYTSRNYIMIEESLAFLKRNAGTDKFSLFDAEDE